MVLTRKEVHQEGLGSLVLDFSLQSNKGNRGLGRVTKLPVSCVCCGPGWRGVTRGRFALQEDDLGQQGGWSEEGGSEAVRL